MIRERWFGATGRKVPEIAVEGDPAVPLEEALVLDGVGDVERLRDAHDRGTPVVVRAQTADEVKAALARPDDRGTPVVVRAQTADEVKAALARPEVACVLVPASSPELLELDLTALTYD